MNPLRLASYILMVVIVATSAGCRTAGVKDLARNDSNPTRDANSASELLVDHNKNAEKIQSIEVRPNITVAGRRAGLRPMSADGRLAIDLPRNFKLELNGPITKVADIGSNDKEFWFWFKENRDQAVYYCNYNANGSSPLAASFQPDWIVEALGLRVIPESEAATIKATPGEPGTWLLTQRQSNRGGETTFKETVISAATHRILKHRVYAADNKTLLTEATISEYESHRVPGQSGQSEETVYLPKTCRLKWEQEKLTLEVNLSQVRVNEGFPQARRETLFTEPVFAGIDRKNLATMAGASQTAAANEKSPTTVRETLPAPPPRVRLSNPTPLGTEGANRKRRDATTIAADLPSFGAESRKWSVRRCRRSTSPPLPRFRLRAVGAITWSVEPRGGDSPRALCCSAARRNCWRAFARMGPTEFSGIPSCLPICR